MLQEWFGKARLGIFIHYGIYAVGGTAESWAFKNGECSYEEYMRQLDGFTASKYDAKKWVELFKKAGASYAVLTAKHHDGVALYDTEFSNLSTVKATPSKADIVTPYCEALRNEGLRVGLYFTQLDWSHPDYLSKAHKPITCFFDKYFSKMKRWNNFLVFHKNQLKEVLTKFGEIDVLWFDGDWERSQADWKMREMKAFLDEFSPKTVVNSRIGSFGDYATPEQQMPVVAPIGAWEYCMTLNDSWGFKHRDNNYKTLFEIIRTFVETITMGGNLLLDIGPKEDGSFDERGEALLLGLGEFIEKNREAVYQSDPIENKYFEGGVMLAEDKKALYLFCYTSISKEMTPLLVERLGDNKVVGVELLGVGNSEFSKEGGDNLWITSNQTRDGVNVFKISFSDRFVEAK